MKISVLCDLEELEFYCKKVGVFIFSFVLLHTGLDNIFFTFLSKLLINV